MKQNAIYKTLKKYVVGDRITKDAIYKETQNKTQIELSKTPSRTEIINYLLSALNRDTVYLEIGVRNPQDNFNHIKSKLKYSVDPGVEFKENPVDFKLTSDEFFKKLGAGEILNEDIKFDVIFIDGLHLAEQVDRDIINALKYIKDDGFIALHDCNPPTEWHAREKYDYWHTPAEAFWNGTTWKAFLKWRCDKSVSSCCIDSDWGVGVISKSRKLGESIILSNPFFEYNKLEANRKEYLNLVSFSDFKKIVGQK
jgi:hypothetical protein